MPRHVRNSASDSQAALTDRPTLSPPSSTHYYYSLPANPTVVTLDGRHSPFAASTIQSKQHKSSFAKNIRPILAMLGAAAMTGAIVAIVFTTPYLTTSGEFSTGAHDGYIVTLTILSTIFAMSITVQIRALLLRQVDEKLNTLRTSGGPRLTESEEFRNLDGRWQTILSIEKFTEKFRHPRIALLYLTTGLITTSIVASFSLSTTTREYSFKSVLPLGPNRCILGWTPSMPAHEAYWWPIVTAGWGMDGGYFIQASLDDCPTREAVTLLRDTNVESPSLHAYADKGVAVESSAIGTPVTIYSSEGCSDRGIYGLQSTDCSKFGS